MTIKFRPHHFLCALGFQGKGYSSQFIANFSAIVTQLNSAQGDDEIIEVVEHTDSICSPCPHRRNLLCTEQNKINQLDQAHAEILNLTAGVKITWGDAKKRIASLMSLEKFSTACAPCEWKKLGICESALRKL